MAGKLRRASANKHRRGPSTPHHKTLCYAIDLRGASLRMTPFWRGLKNIWSGAKNAKRSKKSQALRMTVGGVVMKNSQNRLTLMAPTQNLRDQELFASGGAPYSKVMSDVTGSGFAIAPPAVSHRERSEFRHRPRLDAHDGFLALLRRDRVCTKTRSAKMLRDFRPPRQKNCLAPAPGKPNEDQWNAQPGRPARWVPRVPGW